MDYNLISALRIDLFLLTEVHKINARPAKILKLYEPTNAVNSAWIPQTHGDQIWVIYEFANEEDRIKWENSLPPLIKEWIDRSIIEFALKYGWETHNLIPTYKPFGPFCKN